MKLPLYLTFFIIMSCTHSTTTESNNDNLQSDSIDSKKESISKPSDNSSKGEVVNIKGCGFDSEIDKKQIQIAYPRKREIDQIKKIITFAGLPLNFEIFSANIQNAVATIIEDKRYILYDPSLMDYTDTNIQSYWSSMSILAHEIGHHLSGHTLTNLGSNHKSELEADKFSGFILYKMGASLVQAKAAMSLLANDVDSDSHPAKYKRLNAIENGWNEANKLRFDSAIPPPPEDIVNPDGGIDEFRSENLLNEDNFNSIFVEKSIGTTITNNIEGIILENTNEDTYKILITKINNEDVIGSILNKGSKVDIVFSEDLSNTKAPLGRVELSWLHAIMVQGRKIKFKVGIEGNMPFIYFIYIKSLPAEI